MNLERLVIENGMARALTADALGSVADETGHSFAAKTDLMDVFRKPTRKAICEAYRMTGAIEANEGISILPLLYRAAAADGMDPYTDASRITQDYAISFGHYLAMESIGHGVSWFDDHSSFPLNLPQLENAVLDDPDIAAMLTANTALER